jgi:hypothetical protein
MTTTLGWLVALRGAGQHDCCQQACYRRCQTQNMFLLSNFHRPAVSNLSSILRPADSSGESRRRRLPEPLLIEEADRSIEHRGQRPHPIFV